MTWGSTAPLAAQALTDRWTAALTGVTVIQGPIVSTAPTLKGVSVGYQDESTPAYEGQFASEGVTSIRSREQYTINCLITVRSGSKDAITAQTDAFALLGLIGADLHANPRLDDLVLSVSLGEWALGTTQTNTGANARLIFGVDCDAYTTE